MTDNFLPEYDPPVTPGDNRTLHCLVRDRAFSGTQEELVRQRVLHWLIHERGWSKENLRLEKSYEWVSDPTRRRIRSDLELLDNEGHVLVVVECKRGDIPLGEQVNQQAIEYAIKSKARWVWTTNGKSHGFLKRHRRRWSQVNALEPLDVLSDPPVAKLKFPTSVDARTSVRQYWRSLNDDQFPGNLNQSSQEFVLAVHRVLFGISKKRNLPYSYQGVHILEDRGSAWHRFDNASGGGYYTRYADFIAATQGRVEAVSVAVNLWDNNGGLRLCVGFRKSSRSHHALQLDVGNCHHDEENNCWHIYHDGRMSRIKSAIVLEAVREAQAGHWIEVHDCKEWIYLGMLPCAGTATWTSSKKFLANLIHYGIIRTNLREAQKRFRSAQ